MAPMVMEMDRVVVATVTLVHSLMKEWILHLAKSMHLAGVLLA